MESVASSEAENAKPSNPKLNVHNNLAAAVQAGARPPENSPQPHHHVLDALCPDSQYMNDLSDALNKDNLLRMMNRQELNFKEDHEKRNKEREEDLANFRKMLYSSLTFLNCNTCS